MIGVVTVAVAALVAHAFATTISTFTLGQIENLIYRFLFHRVDRCRAQLGSEFQSVGLIVDEEDLRRALDHDRMRSHQTDRTSTVNGDALPPVKDRLIAWSADPSGRCPKA